MRRTHLILIIGLGILVVGTMISGCHNVHLEVPITTIKTLEDIAVEIEKEIETTISGEEFDSLEKTDEVQGEDIVGAEQTGADKGPSFRVMNDIRVCKNINFNTSNKVNTVYLVQNGSVVETDLHTDMTQVEESAIKFRDKDLNCEVWAYINTNGVLKERPWEGTIVTNEMLTVYPSRVDSIATDNYTGNYTQVAITNTNEETGESVVTVYNDTYVTKKYGETLVALHITKAQAYNSEEYVDEVIVTSDDILNTFSSFQFVNNTEVKVEVKEFRFSEPISFVKETIKEKESEETKESEEGEKEIDLKPLETEGYNKEVEILAVLNSSDMSYFPYNVADKVVEGGQILNSVEVPDKPGMILRVQNTDVIYKSIKQCKLLSLNYDFTEKTDYDISLFGYLKANSRLEDIDTDILNYDSYYINEEGTGYVVYNIGRWDIRTITTYYVMNRLSGLVVEFE